MQDRESDEPEMTDWERFAAEEYELLVAEEGANDMQPEDMWDLFLDFLEITKCINLTLC